MDRIYTSVINRLLERVLKDFNLVLENISMVTFRSSKLSSKIIENFVNLEHLDLRDNQLTTLKRIPHQKERFLIESNSSFDIDF